MPTLPMPAVASADTLLFLGTDASPSVFGANIGRLGNIDFAGVAIDMTDVSNQESTAHRQLGTLLKSGDLTATLMWIPGQTDDDALFELAVTAPPVLRSWCISWAGGLKKWYFSAYLSKFTPKADIGKELSAAITVSIDDSILAV